MYRKAVNIANYHEMVRPVRRSLEFGPYQDMLGSENQLTQVDRVLFANILMCFLYIRVAPVVFDRSFRDYFDVYSCDVANAFDE